MERAGVSMVDGLGSIHGTVWVDYGPSWFVFVVLVHGLYRFGIAWYAPVWNLLG